MQFLKTILFHIRTTSLVVLLWLCSCQNNAEDKAKNNNAVSKTNSTHIDSSVRNNTSIASPANIEILLPTQYRKESQGYPKNVKDKDWYELYKDEASGKWRTDKAILNITYDHDECVGEDVMIIKSKHKNAILFFTMLEGLLKNPITAVEDKSLFPEHINSFYFSGGNYKLSATGDVYNDGGKLLSPDSVKAKDEIELIDTKITSYKLSFTTPQGNSYPIISIAEMQYVMPKAVWIGDLNGDALPDMILNLPEFYEGQHYFFFISDKNDSENPLKKVADIKVVNDC